MYIAIIAYKQFSLSFGTRSYPWGL